MSLLLEQSEIRDRILKLLAGSRYDQQLDRDNTPAEQTLVYPNQTSLKRYKFSLRSVYTETDLRDSGGIEVVKKASEENAATVIATTPLRRSKEVYTGDRRPAIEPDLNSKDPASTKIGDNVGDRLQLTAGFIQEQADKDLKRYNNWIKSPEGIIWAGKQTFLELSQNRTLTDFARIPLIPVSTGASFVAAGKGIRLTRAGVLLPRGGYARSDSAGNDAQFTGKVSVSKVRTALVDLSEDTGIVNPNLAIKFDPTEPRTKTEVVGAEVKIEDDKPTITAGNLSVSPITEDYTSLANRFQKQDRPDRGVEVEDGYKYDAYTPDGKTSKSISLSGFALGSQTIALSDKFGQSLEKRNIHKFGSEKDPINVYGIQTQELDNAPSDIIPFKINVRTADTLEVLLFKAYITEMSDNYTGQWNSTKYIGRAEELYNYVGFNRQFSFGFILAAHNKDELKILYQKLNRLVGSTAPTYNATGEFMRGNFIELTIGDYVSKLPGHFTNIAVSWEQNYPWEIGITDKGAFDEAALKVPHVLNVSLTYQPIHRFNPSYGEVFIGTSEKLEQNA